MPAILRCEHCQEMFSVQAADRRVRCPHCGCQTDVPEAMAALPSPILPGQADVSAALPAEPVECEEADTLVGAGIADRSSRALPWAISIMANAAVALSLLLITLIAMPSAEGRPIPVPDTRMQEALSARIVEQESPIRWPPKPEPPGGKPGDHPRPVPGVVHGEEPKDIDVIGLAKWSGVPGDGDTFGPGGPGKGDKLGGIFPLGNTRNVVFVIDRSGSMTTSLRFVMQEMLTTISRMSPKQKVHVILFGEDLPMEVASRRLVQATWDNKATVAAFVDTVEAEGRTDPVPALERAFGVLRSAEGGKLICLLTDGVFPDNAAVFQTIGAKNPRKDVQINTVLFGSREAEAKTVMRRIAADNGGRFKCVSWDEVH